MRATLQRVKGDFNSDEILRALAEDQSTASFALQRMRELTDNALLAETEAQLRELKTEN